MNMATILIAEDDATLRAGLAIALESEGYEVRACADGGEALADYSAKVNYTQYKHAGGRLYAFYEFTYTDPTTGLETGSKLLIFVR